jgi:hypothetical protein
VFSGGFDLKSAWAVAGSDDIDEYAILDLLDALVRKSLLIADRSTGGTRFSMLETIRQFAEEQLVARGDATDARNTHARHFAGCEADILALWDSPRQREAYTRRLPDSVEVAAYQKRPVRDQGAERSPVGQQICQCWSGVVTHVGPNRRSVGDRSTTPRGLSAMSDSDLRERTPAGIRAPTLMSDTSAAGAQHDRNMKFPGWQIPLISARMFPPQVATFSVSNRLPQDPFPPHMRAQPCLKSSGRTMVCRSNTGSNWASSDGVIV